MIFINRKGQGYTETVDQIGPEDFPTAKERRKEAKRLVNEYRLSDPSGAFWLSSRACKGWA